jgi:maltooligosyltrehalose trehalohydrolase
VIESKFPWCDSNWTGIFLKAYIIYELHVGTFTAAGTFEAIIPHLQNLADLGITTIELMPIDQFPGERNRGYHGVNLYAAQHSYGGPPGLKELVNACHWQGIAVMLNAVYNHLRAGGQAPGCIWSLFTDRYETPWGKALNFEVADANGVRWFSVENSHYWVNDCNNDALRLDAAHPIQDNSPRTFLEELVKVIREEAKQLDRKIYPIAESSDNYVRLIQSRESGSYGAAAQWNYDFDRCLPALLTGERTDIIRTTGMCKTCQGHQRSICLLGGVFKLSLRRAGHFL